MVCLDTQIRVMLSFPLPYSFEFLCTLFLVRLFARGIAVVVILEALLHLLLHLLLDLGGVGRSVCSQHAHHIADLDFGLWRGNETTCYHLLTLELLLHARAAA